MSGEEEQSTWVDEMSEPVSPDDESRPKSASHHARLIAIAVVSIAAFGALVGLLPWLYNAVLGALGTP